MKYYVWLQYGGADQEPPDKVWTLEIDLCGMQVRDFKAGKQFSSWDVNTSAIYSEEAPHADYPFTIGLIPVHSSRLTALIHKECPDAVQYLPIRVKNRLTLHEIDGYSIANYLKVIDCLDREQADYEIWTKANLLFWEKRPWLLGTFRTINKFVLQSSRLTDDKVFWLWGWPMTIIREDIKTLIEQAAITGCRFHEIKTV